jgi:hypothetical protein
VAWTIGKGGRQVYQARYLKLKGGVDIKFCRGSAHGADRVHEPNVQSYPASNIDAPNLEFIRKSRGSAMPSVT